MLGELHPAHPRGSGEHEPLITPNLNNLGSSPRERGAPAAGSTPTSTLRLIPAGAGSTSPALVTRRRKRAHPRGSGEHPRPNAPWILLGGSSPRERGARQQARRHLERIGLIPAGAGSTVQGLDHGQPSRAHPRGSGEHSGSCTAGGAGRGSSPRERGALSLAGRVFNVLGLIPAGAGSTRDGSPASTSSRAHPRGSGEHRTYQDVGPLQMGSSPRERGARMPPPDVSPVTGLIPAGAGSTSCSRSACRRRRAHPRGSGEHSMVAHSRSSRTGSSPRERGAPTTRAAAVPPTGLIPAGAGSTCCRRPISSGRWAHPRGSGEHRN